MPTQNWDGSWTDDSGKTVVGGGTGTSQPTHGDQVTIKDPYKGDVPGTMNGGIATPKD